MPKREIIQKPGEPISDETRWLVERFFKPKEIEKLQRLGGRILISIAAPYKPRGKKAITIDEAFISNLWDRRQNFETIRQMLDELSKKQLKDICKKINHPVKSAATSEEIKREIIRSLQAEDYWNSISRG